MELLKLVRLLPMLIMVGALSYAAYTINGLTATPVALNGQKPEAALAEAVLAEMGPPLTGQIGPRPARDPFSQVVRPDLVAKAAAKKAAVDPIPALLQGMELSGTFIQGKAQYAVIDGRLYKVGQNLQAPGPAGSLVLSRVDFHNVQLSDGDRTYTLGYPDRLTPRRKPEVTQTAAPNGSDAAILAQDPNLELIRMLLRSPLGGMGRAMLGAQGVPAMPLSPRPPGVAPAEASGGP